jgi:hypothetical protein
MLFQIIVLALIILATLYWAWQGVFSCTLMLVAAVFSSVAAIGGYEELTPLFAKFRPDYAQPVAFFLLFAFCFSLLRIVGGILAPKNVRLSKVIDLAVGFPLAFLTAIMSFGTMVIALEMVPTHQVMFGYDRYPNGLAKEPVQLWIPADQIVQWVWKQTSGGSLGGGESFASVHPDLDRELYGNRHVVTFGSHPEVSPELADVPAVFEVTEPADMKALQISPDPNTPQKLVVVRSQITKGGQAPHMSSDGDDYYRITPAEIRLITTTPLSGAQQFNPIGYLDKGTVFKPLDLDLGHLVDDYNPDGNLIHDWVFMIPGDNEPKYFEEKSLTRKDVAAVLAAESKPNTVVAGTGYSPEDWKKFLPSLQVVVTHSYGEATDQPVAGRPFYLFKSTVTKRRIRSYIDECYDLLDKGNRMDKESWRSRMLPMKVQWDDDHPVPISDFLEFWLAMHETTSPKADVRHAEREIQDQILPILRDPEKHLLVWATSTGPDGKTPAEKIAPGGYVGVTWIIESSKDDLHFWHVDIVVPKVEGAPLIVKKFDDTNAYVRKPDS